jgi:hypothetical protein
MVEQSNFTSKKRTIRSFLQLLSLMEDEHKLRTLYGPKREKIIGKVPMLN